MAFAISPKHMSDDFPGGMKLDDKIEVFIARVEGWQLGVAKEMVEKGVSHRGFALLHVVTSYFEMIAKYQAGYVGSSKSEEYFVAGVRDVFPVLANWPQQFVSNVLDALYGGVRCGLYHAGMVKGKVALSGDLPAPMVYHVGENTVWIDPDKLVDALLAHFAEYADKLRNPGNVDLRTKFQARLDLDNA